MSLTATPEIASRNHVCVSRVIPGISIRTQTVPKKPSSSIRLEARLSSKPVSVQYRREDLRTTLGDLAVTALPTASTDGDRCKLAQAIAADFMIVSLSIFLAHAIASFSQPPFPSAWESLGSLCHDFVQNDLGITILYGALITLLGYSEGLFRPVGIGHREELKMLCRSVAWGTLLLIGATSLSGGGTVSLGMLLAAGLLSALGMYSQRLWQRRASRRRAAEGKSIKNVLIVGTGRPAREIADHFQRNPHLGRAVRGFVNEKGRGGMEILGPVSNLAQIARAHFIDEVIVTILRDKELARTSIAEALRNHLDVKIVPDLLGFSPHRTAVERLGSIPIIPLNEEPIPEFGLTLKRLVDLVLSGVGLLATAPLLALIAIAIKLDSTGPVLYRALRAGKKGWRFNCYKFRTMRTDADLVKDSLRERNEREGPIFKISSDPRITPVGRILRRYSLDELPQLWNVWKGEMSLVGPRPHPLDDYARYQLEHLRRLDVMPGITGLWQVTARRDPSFHTNMALDLEYIEHWSLSRDLQIIMKTFSAVLSGSGA